MGPLGIAYDIHGNLPALEAVLEDAGALGVERWVLGGDYALFGAWPAETVALLRSLDATWIRGNGERWTAHPGAAPDPARPAAERCAELLGPGLVAELDALPETLRDGERLYCHASPRSDVEGFTPEPGPADEALVAGAGEGVRRLVVGHTHLPFSRAVAGVELLNPGSVGMPFDGDRRAAYAVLGEGGELERRRVDYDHAASAAAVRERLGAAGETAAMRIEQARADPA